MTNQIFAKIFKDLEEDYQVDFYAFGYSHIMEFNHDYFCKWLEENKVTHEVNGDTIAIPKTNPKEILDEVVQMLKELDSHPLLDDDDYSIWETEKYQEYWEEEGKDDFIRDISRFIKKSTHIDVSEEDLQKEKAYKVLMHYWEEFYQADVLYYMEDSYDSFLIYLRTEDFWKEYGDKILIELGLGDRRETELYYAEKDPRQLKLL